MVFEDAELDQTVKELTRSALNMASQICVAAARFLIQDSIVQDLKTRITEAFRNVRTGPGSDPASQMGAVIDTANQQRLMRLIEQAADEGDLILTDGPLERGAFLTPTLFRIDDVRSALVQEELFEPIVSVETFGDEAEAVEKAKATHYGLAASVLSQNLSRATRWHARFAPAPSGRIRISASSPKARPVASASRVWARSTGPRGSTTSWRQSTSNTKPGWSDA